MSQTQTGDIGHDFKSRAEKNTRLITHTAKQRNRAKYRYGMIVKFAIPGKMPL